MAKGEVSKYIEEKWDSCIKENKDGEGTLIGLPYPYTVPAIGHFDEMYYWDTYFTNVGLIVSGRQLQAKHNTDNMLYLVDQYGYMPNGNRTYYLDRSQPPFLSLMVRDVYECYKDKIWLKKAYETLQSEYSFWMKKRRSDIGLNTYGNNQYVDMAENYAKECIVRMGYTPDDTVENIAKHFVATAESGWDISPRFGTEAHRFVPVDLNSIMYMFEMNMSYFAEELEDGTEVLWQQKAQMRKERMITYLDNGNGLLLDYNLSNGQRSNVLSAATFYPLFAGIADSNHINALMENLNRLEAEHGILSCERCEAKGIYQWGYPNGWPCLQYIAVCGLDRYGYQADAKRIAEKYIALVETVFDKTHKLWEKYNVVEGNINVINEYHMPEMMGWTAGVYLWALNYVKEKLIL